MKNYDKADRKFELGIHTYSLHLSGLGQNWGFVGDYQKQAMTLEDLMDKAIEWGLDGLHVTNVDLRDHDPKNLAAIKENAQKHKLWMEYNVSVNEEFDKRMNQSFDTAPKIAEQIGADVIKYSLDIRRPKPIYGSQFHPDVMKQLIDVVEGIKKALPEYERTGIHMAIEHHTETYADEIAWVIEQVNHPLIGSCVDTINSLDVLESPEYAIERLAPYCFSVHMCDNEMIRDQHGAHFIGVPLGQGDIDNHKTLQTLKELAPAQLTRINFENEWSTGNDDFETARQKELDACVESIRYCREVLGIGKRTPGKI